MLADAWEICEKTYNGKRYFWHKNELEAMEVQVCQIEGVKYDPPEIKLGTFKVRKYTMEGIGSFICMEKAVDKQLLVGRMNGEKFKIMIRDEMNTKLGVEPT